MGRTGGLGTDRSGHGTHHVVDPFWSEQAGHFNGLQRIDPVHGLHHLRNANVVVGQLSDIRNDALIILDEDLVRLLEVRPHEKDAMRLVRTCRHHFSYAPLARQDIGAAHNNEGLCVLPHVAEEPCQVIEVITIHKGIEPTASLAQLHLQQPRHAAGLNLLVAQEKPEWLAVLEHDVPNDAVSDRRHDGQEHQTCENQADEHRDPAIHFRNEEGAHVKDDQHTGDERHVQEVARHSPPRLTEGRHGQTPIEKQVHANHLARG
mmetsp:Transcript_51038/g.118917  ORF Transcript_51038/g.118917 Transcript_51038/m.118917 type:complete len:262 (-) Transcript_51038:2420-3205(-)